MHHPDFGNLYKLRGIIFYRVSSFELKAYGKALTHGVPNMIRRMGEEFLYVVPPFAIGYIIYDQVDKLHERMQRKNPADYENDC